MSAIGNSGARSSGPTGSWVPGCSGGGGGAGRSGMTLYHCVGCSDSSSRIFVGVSRGMVAQRTELSGDAVAAVSPGWRASATPSGPMSSDAPSVTSNPSGPIVSTVPSSAIAHELVGGASMP